MEYFQRFKYIVACIKGDKHVVADALTRNLDIEIGMPDNDLPYQAWPHTPLHEVFSMHIAKNNSMLLEVCASSNDAVLEFRPASAPEHESAQYEPPLVGFLRALSLRAERSRQCGLSDHPPLTRADALSRIQLQLLRMEIRLTQIYAIILGEKDAKEIQQLYGLAVSDLLKNSMRNQLATHSQLGTQGALTWEIT